MEDMDPTTPRPWTDITGPVPDLRLVVLDMDGTLLDGADAVPDSFWRLLPALHERGILVVPASGRQYATLHGMFAEHGVRTFICENGTLVVHDGEVVSSSPMDTPTVQRVIDIVRTGESSRDLGLVVCGPTKAYTEREDAAFLAEARRYYRSLEVVPNLHSVPELEAGTVLKCAVYDFDSAAQAAPALFTGGGPGVADLRKSDDGSADGGPADRGSADGGHQVVVSGRNWIDIMAGATNKGRALRALEMTLGVPRSGTAVFGDYLNDLEMMAEADWSFAMDNGHPAVQRAARFIAPPNTEEGVVQVLRRLLGA